jgi:CoA-transferase family III
MGPGRSKKGSQSGLPVGMEPTGGSRSAAEMGPGRSKKGSISRGGATRLLQTSDGYLALSLARPDDVGLLPALFGDALALDPSIMDSNIVESFTVDLTSSATDAIWSSVATMVRRARAQEVVDRGIELGLAIAALPPTPRLVSEVTDPTLSSSTDHQHRDVHGVGGVSDRLTQAVVRTNWLASDGSICGHNSNPLRVVDLSSLWAGPLCGQLLASAGCEVIKVESLSRPDGARLGSPEFFDLLNGQKRSVTLDFANHEDLRALIDLLASADVVIEASRPRALEQLGIDRQTLLATTGISVWLQITGHGASGRDANRIGFGDDAAVAGGLVSWDGNQPVFCADAIADPATGLVAASAVTEALGAGGKWLLDASLRRTAEAMSYGPILHWEGEVTAPNARAITCHAPEPGLDTQAIISALSSRPTSGSQPC